MKNLIVLLLTAMAIGLCGCGREEQTEIKIIKDPVSISQEESNLESGEKSDLNEQIVNQEGEIPDMGAWVIYWDYATSYDEICEFGDKLNTIGYFAAYFDKDNEPFIPKGTLETINEYKENGTFESHTSFLTFVNDKALESGSSLKDTELLYALLGDSNLASAHATRVLDMTEQMGCDGVEIDYEAIKKDKKLWGHFNEFTKILTSQAKERNIKVRILFEPSAPIDEYEWPDYPEYVMMCYNLYGYGTKPGPKATGKWIKEMVKKMEYLPGQINFALATGGFDFKEDGAVSAINTAAALKLEKDTDAVSTRDEESFDLVFNYTDDEGKKHEVWYADKETIKKWVEAVNETGHSRITIWRLGSNIE